MIVTEERLILGPNDIRAILHEWIKSELPMTADALLINELGFYNANSESMVDDIFRADVALTSSKLIGFEIKSEKDSLKRWPSQMKGYTNVFDEVWLCVHTKHLKAALELTGDHVGILVIDNNARLSMVRKAYKDGLNNIYDLACLLWKDELKELVALCGMKAKSRDTRRDLRLLLVDHASLVVVRDFVLAKIKLRRTITE